MTTHPLIPSGNYVTGSSISPVIQLAPGETTGRVTIDLFTMGNDADTLKAWTDVSDDGVNWVTIGSFYFEHMVRQGGAGANPFSTLFQNYYNLKAFLRLRWAVTGTGQIDASLTTPAAQF